jgi:nitroimidazol reductase NimA-like FMN-containing flavoprotein (pyridoxamine 5'-phosphate oxidase superfamily)
VATSMSPAEVEEYLASQRTIVVTTLRPDGSPVAHPLWFVKLGRNVYIDTRANSIKHRNILNDPRVCAVVESGESYFELRGVRIEGACQPVTDDEEIERVQAALDEKDRVLGSGMAEMPDWFAKNRTERRSRGDRVMLRIPMDRVYSWDFSQARKHYVPAESPDPGDRSAQGPKQA